MSVCDWALVSDRMRRYHDEEWGTPVYENAKLFEFLVLETFQAGLSWATVLNKRDHFREAFDQFKPESIAYYDSDKIQALLHNSGIIRNRLKIHATVTNARAYLAIHEQGECFSDLIWQFVDGQPVCNHWESIQQLPAISKTSQQMSRFLKQKGFRFVGPTICYAYMQAVGLVNDHIVTCFRHQELH
jgi:DNA-3-methyladenine glycosylase I